MQHVTQAKRLLKQLLWTRLPVVLAQADTDAADSVTTPPPYEIHTTDKEALGGYPALEIICTNSRRKNDSWAKVYEHRVVVGFTLTGDDEECLTVQVERYMWSIRFVADETQQRPDEPIGTVDAQTEQYSLLDNQPTGVEHPFVKGGWIELLMTTAE